VVGRGPAAVRGKTLTAPRPRPPPSPPPRSPRYEKYVVTRDADAGAGDAFGAALAEVLVMAAALMAKADEAAAAGGDRATRAALNAEIRYREKGEVVAAWGGRTCAHAPPTPSSRGKAALFETDLPALDRLARRGWKKLPPGALAEREARTAAARDAVTAVPDGVHAPRAGAGGPPRPRAAGQGKVRPVVMLDEAKMGKRHDADGYYAGSEAVTAFRKVC